MSPACSKESLIAPWLQEQHRWPTCSICYRGGSVTVGGILGKTQTSEQGLEEWVALPDLEIGWHRLKKLPNENANMFLSSKPSSAGSRDGHHWFSHQGWPSISSVLCFCWPGCCSSLFASAPTAINLLLCVGKGVLFIAWSPTALA